jgi:hypothetical protein
MAGYALILWDPRRQGLHDKIGQSVVRYVPRPEDSLTAAPSGVAGNAARETGGNARTCIGTPGDHWASDRFGDRELSRPAPADEENCCCRHQFELSPALQDQQDRPARTPAFLSGHQGEG